MLQLRVRPFRGRSLSVVCAVCVLLLMVMAGPAAATKYAGAFMENGGGARALGMGGAFTAIADDPSATFWNPAGLAGVQESELLIMHSERFGDLIDRDFVAYTQPVNWSLFGGESAGLGLTIIRLGIDDIPFTAHLAEQLDTDGDGEIDDPELAGLFNLRDQFRYESDQELALMFSYGENLGSWRVGGTLKFIRQTVGDYSSLGVGVDVAMLRPELWRHLDFGVKFQDLTTTYLSWSTGRNELIAPAIIPGFAWHQPAPQWNMRFTMATSFETRFEDRQLADQYSAGDISTNVHLGGEIAFAERVFLRGGVDSGWDAGNVTAGAGFRIDPLTVDYAYGGDTLDIDEITHRISVSARF